MGAPISASLGAMGSLLGKLDVLLAPEYRLPKEAKDGIQLLRCDLQEIVTSLVDLSEAADPPLTAKCWMKDVRELSYDMEDYVDELLHSGADAKAGTVRKGGRFKIGRLPWTLKRQPLITNRVSEFRSHVQEAIQRHERYNLGDCISRRRHLSVGPMLPTEYTEIDDLFDGPRNELVKWLTNEEEQQLKVVSIVGSGGLGKTTLARKLYHKLGGFDCRAFLHTSRKPDMKRLLGGMLSQLRHHHQPPDACEVPELIHTIRTHLHDKRYLIVIDDLWATSLWNSISHAFPEGNRSRIITTTQIEEVALTCCSYHQDYILKMKRLNMDQSRKLFFKRVFGSEDDCPQQFRGISLGIIKRCGGLPLAIISIASLLASQPVLLMEQWVYIHDSLLASNLQISTSEGMRQVLNLSYDNLPHYLKTCLLYLNTYPEDYTILKDDLVKQWVAEGFINAIEGQDMEEVAGSYFDELVNRRMIQPMDTDYKHEVFMVHGMLLDLIAYKSMEDNFNTAVDYSQNTIGLCDKVRRLSCHFGSAKYAKTPATIGLSQVRSLAFFGLFKSMPPITEFNLLRVLILQIWGDCGGTSVDLTRICELHQLRYLQISCDVSIEIPTLMQRLQCLETVEIYARLTTVPLDIVHLPRLLHLCLPGETNLLGSVGHMRSLRRLGYIDLSSNSFDTVRSLGELTNLRNLHLACCTVPSDHLERNMQCLGSILGKLSNLKSLTLVSTSSRANILVPCDGLSFVSPVPCLLQRLELLPRICIFSSLPKWIGGLGELCTLKIAVWELRRNDVDTLKRLSTLTILSLCVKQAPLQRITFHSMEFPVLRYFKFRCRVACLTFGEGAMPNLRRLKLGFNAHGAERHIRLPLPTGLENLLSLEELTARIGHRGATESDRRAAESALTTMIGVHRRCPGVNIFWVDWIFDLNESISRGTQEGSRILEEHGILEIEPEQEYGIAQRDEKQKYHMDEGDTRTSMSSGSHTSNLASSGMEYTGIFRRVGTTKDGSRSSRASLVKIFSFNDLRLATSNFGPDSVLGEGRFGSVYKGWIDENTLLACKPGTGIAVAVKILHQEDLLRPRLAEDLGQFCHPNVVKLIGYCIEDEHRLLVHEFMPRGSLESHLFRRGPHFQPLSWNLRMKIALGAAKGLAYLHSAEAQVIHRGFMTSNILLDTDYSAKLSDFGLAIFGEKSHVSTREMGRYGYAAPEYLSTGHTSAKSNIYSFGVVLLEMLSGRRGIYELVDCAQPYLTDKRKILDAMDSRLEGKYPRSGAQTIVDLALDCLRVDAKKRPSMDDVVSILEELQEVQDADLKRAAEKHQESKGAGKKAPTARAGRNSGKPRRKVRFHLCSRVPHI